MSDNGSYRTFLYLTLKYLGLYPTETGSNIVVIKKEKSEC